MINLRITELHNKPVAACAESSVHVLAVFFLVSICFCLKATPATCSHVKHCCWTLLCVNVDTALPTPTLPTVFMSHVVIMWLTVRPIKCLKHLKQKGVLFSATASGIELNKPSWDHVQAWNTTRYSKKVVGSNPPVTTGPSVSFQRIVLVPCVFRIYLGLVTYLQ